MDGEWSCLVVCHGFRLPATIKNAVAIFGNAFKTIIARGRLPSKWLQLLEHVHQPEGGGFGMFWDQGMSVL